MRRFATLAVTILLSGAFLLATPATNSKKKKRSTAHKQAASTSTRKPVAKAAVARAGTTAPLVRASLHRLPVTSSVVRRRRPAVAGGPWKSPTYSDSTLNDNVDGED